MILFLGLVALVAGITLAMKTSWGEKIGDFAPTPFWIYFVPIVLATFGILPHDSPVYDSLSLRALPAALVLMLIGTPLKDLFKLSSQAVLAMVIASTTMVIGVLLSFLILIRFLPSGSEQVAGALLATWVGGSANMLAVKEILQMPDSRMAPLIIVDTFMSYAWMALLIFGAGWQKKYDQWAKAKPTTVEAPVLNSGALTFGKAGLNWILLLIVGFGAGEVGVQFGKLGAAHWPILSPRAWTIILISILALGLAATPLQKLHERGASRVGGYLLYLVLATIGVKTTLQAAKEAPIFLLFGLLILLIHGILLLICGKWKRISLFLLSTASQAAVGGPVSAPIVAEVYQPGTAPIGVLMAILGALAGTYIGLFGTWICHLLSRLFYNSPL